MNPEQFNQQNWRTNAASREARLLGLAILVGVLGGLAMLAYDLFFHWFATNIQHLKQAAPEGPIGLILPPVLIGTGAMTARWLTDRLTDNSGDHSTDQVIHAFHEKNGDIPARSGPLVALTSTLTVGTGGSAGREAQGALIGAGIGAFFGRLLNLSVDQRRLIMLMGVSAGLSAMFKTPVGAAFIAIEILYRRLHFEPEALIYTLASSVVAFIVVGQLTGWSTDLRLPTNLQLTHAADYGAIVAVGIAGGLVAAVMPTIFYGASDWFARLRLPSLLKPFLGGVVVGAIGLAAPEILGDGTTVISSLIHSDVAVGVLFVMAGLKLLTMTLTIGSGGIGGVLSPSLFIGAMIGAGIGQLFGVDSHASGLVGMATIFAGAARVPVGTLLMVPELTGDYLLLPPTALAICLSYLIQVVLAERLRWPSIHHRQPANIWASPAHRNEVLATGLDLLHRGGITLPDGINMPDLRALLSVGYPIRLGQGNLVLFTANVQDKSPAIDVPLSNFPLGNGVWLLEIRRGDAIEQPRSDSRLSAGDSVVIMTSLQSLPDLQAAIDFPPVFQNWLARHEPDTHAICFPDVD